MALGLVPLMILCVMPASASAASLQPLYGASAGAACKVSITSVYVDYYNTSVVNGSGNLEIIRWHDTRKALVRVIDATAGMASDIASGAFYNGATYNYLVTAVINGSGNLELITWTVNFQGLLTRVASYTTSTAITEISLSGSFGA